MMVGLVVVAALAVVGFCLAVKYSTNLAAIKAEVLRFEAVGETDVKAVFARIKSLL